MMILALSLLQASAPTVGDTIWVERVVEVAPQYLAQVPEWELEGDIELLGTPVLRREGDSIRLAFPLVAWRPGDYTVSVPGPRLIAQDGHVEDIPSLAMILTVRSVLPDVPKDSLAVRPEAGVIPRPVVSLWPMALLLGIAALIMGPAWWLWLRRGRAGPSRAAPRAPDPPLERWIEAGERRAVLAAATGAVRDAVAKRIPDAHTGLETEACIAALTDTDAMRDSAIIASLLRDLDEARFAPEGSDAVVELFRRATESARTLAEVDSS